MSYYILLDKKARKACKQHQCIWCGRIIEMGETYINEQSVYEDCFQNHHWHPECFNACEKEHCKKYDYEYDAYGNERPKVTQ